MMFTSFGKWNYLGKQDIHIGLHNRAVVNERNLGEMNPNAKRSFGNEP